MRGKTRVLFLSTHNAARSQMAEAYLRAMGDRYEVASGGTAPSHVHPLAIRAMRESGLDISDHTAKPVKPFVGEVWHYVITVCDEATEQCQFFPSPPSPCVGECQTRRRPAGHRQSATRGFGGSAMTCAGEFGPG